MCKFAVMIKVFYVTSFDRFLKSLFSFDFFSVLHQWLLVFLFPVCSFRRLHYLKFIMLKYYWERHCRKASPRKKVLPYIKSSESLLKFLVCEGHPIRGHSYGFAFLISVLYLFPFNVMSSLKSGPGFDLFFPETGMEHWNECLLMLLDRLSVERLLLLCH